MNPSGGSRDARIQRTRTARAVVITAERLRLGVVPLAAILLAACGGGGGGSGGGAAGGGTGGGGTGGGGAQSFAVGGAVTGLSGTGLVLQVNGGNDLSLTSSGNFNFATPVAAGASYNVSIRTQPSNPTQTCVLSNSSGTIGSANVTNVAVTCTTNTYSVGGTVSGVSVDAGLVLQNGGEELAVSRNGSFVFTTGVLSGAVYNVTVRMQPTAPVQACAVMNASGTMGSTAVADVIVSCDGIALLAGTLGGSGTLDGLGAAARFNNPTGVTIDSAGNLYVADTRNSTIRKITSTGAVSTLAGTPGAAGSTNGDASTARFNSPAEIAFDAAGNAYVADEFNHTIRRITPAGVVSTLAGAPGQTGILDGNVSVARFRNPRGITSDAAGNLYVADSENHTIRKITPAGMVSTFAGLPGQAGAANGSSSTARFNFPRGLATDAAGNVYVADTTSHTIRKITSAGVVSTFAGAPGQSGSADGTVALFRRPTRLAVDSAGNLFVADTGNHTIRRITPAGVVSTIAGAEGMVGAADGNGSAARFSSPGGIAVDSAGNLYVADSINETIRKISPAREVSTFASAAIQIGSDDGSGSAARFAQPYGVATDAAGNVYVADTDNHTIRKITPAGAVTTLAGTAGEGGSVDGVGPAARFSMPVGVVTDAVGNIYVADRANHIIRKISPSGVVSTLAGSAAQTGTDDGTGSAARFNEPYNVATDAAGNVYVADTNNHMIRKITPAGVVSTFAGSAGNPGADDGSGTAARFYAPLGVDADSVGNLYVADATNHIIRKITPEGVVSTLAGTAQQEGSSDGVGSAARFTSPIDVAVDAAGNVYVTDMGNHTIRRVTPDGTVTTVAGTLGSYGVRLGPLPGSLMRPAFIALLPGPRITLVTTVGEKGILLITP